MSLDLLGDGFDLHGGGRDLAFPHHENERAQAVAEGRPFARHWVHNGWVEVDGTKMSKSLGNFTSLTDLLARSDGRAYRLLVLRAHYRSPIEVTAGTVADAEKALARLDTLARRFSVGDLLARHRGGLRGRGHRTGHRRRPGRPGPVPQPHGRRPRLRRGPSPGSSNSSRRPTRAPTPGTTARARQLAHSAAVLAAALGLSLRGDAAEVDEETARLVAERDEARAARDFARADALRDELTAMGWTVEDTPAGTAVRRWPGGRLRQTGTALEDPPLATRHRSPARRTPLDPASPDRLAAQARTGPAQGA